MMRRNGVVGWSLGVFAAVLTSSCARPPAISREPAVSEASSPVDASPGPSHTIAAPVDGALSIREIKIIDDNGQQGLFVKLTRPPAAVTHYTLTQPNRLVIDIAGPEGSQTSETNAEKYAVQNPVVSELGVARHDGKIRVTLRVKGEVPSYDVNDLNDTVVAFLGERNGGSEPVHEQVVMSQRVGSETEPALTEAPLKKAPAKVASAPIAKSDTSASGGLTTTTEIETPSGARPAYHGQHVSLDFKDADIHNVLRLLAEVSKLNMVATDDVRGKITLRLFDVPWDQALDIVLHVMNLEMEQEGNVIRISSVKRLREEREELEKANEAAKAVEPVHVEYIKVNYAKADKLAGIISGAARVKSTVAGAVRATGPGTGADQGVLSSRGSVFVDEFSNTIVVRDIARGIDAAREVVRRLDIQTPQVLIESNIVETTTDFSRDIGVQWGYRASLGPQTGNPTNANFPGTVGLGGSGLGISTSGLPFIADFPAAVNPGSGSALDLALGSIDGAHNLDLRLSALESDGRARIISRPRVVTLNNVAATIKSLTIIRVKLPSTGTVINTGAGGAAGTADTATEKIETGIVLIVTPQVSSDGYVMLDMYAKSSQADFTRTVDDIPTEVSREANSHILVKNGQTVVLGGIYRDNYTDTYTGIPFLKDIPLLGWLFRDRAQTNPREDLLVFLTPRILGALQPGLPSATDLWTHRE